MGMALCVDFLSYSGVSNTTNAQRLANRKVGAPRQTITTETKDMDSAVVSLLWLIRKSPLIIMGHC